MRDSAKVPFVLGRSSEPEEADKTWISLIERVIGRFAKLAKQIREGTQTG